MVSIIVTTKNEEKTIERLLISLKKQTYKNYEIIIVDNFSIDNTLTISKKFTRKVYSKGPERSVQRNYGAKKAKGNYLFFLDADMELTTKVVEECVRKISKDKSIGAIAVPEISVAKTYWEKVKAYERSFYNESGDITTDAERFFTKKAFNSVHGYDETITGPEDWDLPESIKAKGYKATRIKSKIYHYEKVSNPFKLAQKKYYYGLKSHRYFKKQKVSAISPKTIYFFRPIFYKKWKKLVGSPVLAISMYIMFSFELFGGGMGYLVGKYKNL